MLGTPFSHDLTKKYVVAFGTLFNDIKLQRISSSGTQWISVPLSYASKEKWFQRLTNPNLTQQVQSVLPHISYELVTMTYDEDRKKNTLNRRTQIISSDEDRLRSIYAPVPYNLQFSLYIYSRNALDSSNILEQILPFFTPEFTVTLNNATDLNVDIDCPIILNSVNREDAYEGDFESARTIIWTLDFTMKGVFYGPVRNSKQIKKAYIDFFIPSSVTASHSGTVANNSVYNGIVFLQANTASRENDIYNRGKITFTEYPNSGVPTSIEYNEVDVIDYDGSSQKITFNDTESIGAISLDSSRWTYNIVYPIESDNQGIFPGSLAHAPTAARIFTRPGLTANGDPTSNAELSVVVGDIYANDDFGIIQTHTFFPSNTVLVGTRRNLSTGIDEDV